MVKNPFAVLDENPWDYDAEKLAQHCREVKSATVPLTDPTSISWQDKV